METKQRIPRKLKKQFKTRLKATYTCWRTDEMRIDELTVNYRHAHRKGILTIGSKSLTSHRLISR